MPADDPCGLLTKKTRSKNLARIDLPQLTTTACLNFETASSFIAARLTLFDAHCHRRPLRQAKFGEGREAFNPRKCVNHSALFVFKAIG
jgi:hypothetical protein